MTDTPDEPPIHVALSEPPTDSRARPGVPGRSVRLQGKLHDFGDLIPAYGSVFTSRLLDAFTSKYVHATGSTTERRSKNLRRLLLFWASLAINEAERGRPVGRVFKALMEGAHATITREDMVDAVEEYTKSLRDLRDFSVVATTNELTRQNIIESVSPILQELGKEGLWPDIGPLKGLPGSRVSRGNNIPALGELIVGLPASAAASSARDGGADIIELSRKRLIRLRQLFEGALLKEEAAFNRQVDLSKDNRVTISEIREAVRCLPTDYDRERVLFELPYPVRKCFPLGDEDLRLSSLLRYIKAEHGGTFGCRIYLMACSASLRLAAERRRL